MASYINTNIASLNAQRNLTTSQSSLTTALQRLSSGMRINSAKDDAAGLAISERMTSQINGNNQAARNANDGISMAQTAEGDLAQIGNNLQRMRSLSVQSANATNSASDRTAIQNEITQLSSEIDRTAQSSSFNGVKLLNGSFQNQTFQVGANNVAAQDQITISSISSARTSSLGQFQGFTLTGQSIGTASNTAAAQSVTVGGATTSLGTIANDAKALASAINSSGVSGLGATANATAVAAATQTITTTTAGTVTLTVNGTAITVNATTNAATNRTNAVTALNAQSSVTGVVATDTGSGVSLAAADGRNIATAFALGTAVGTTMADFGMAAAGTTGATLNVTYQAPAGTTGNVVFTGAFSNTTAIAATGTAISAIDVSTVSGAQTALTAIDAALASVNTSRASLGAYQNRFSSVVASLQTTAENLTASRSRIQDTDFAAETANLTRGQILQQAGTAMLAQANALPNGVLALLR
ncbi:flagellin [Sulfuriferula sp.]|uniref:flagellin N-terminal helical domain-containing protein n=1 Tax=Sulfuriferula sp. TaxID=2025307 RepID=UPI0027313623|nr:flagellin [Sulfuriferula sp.]MDP2025193.1 flagellin [Sulfuriferula sp.]